MISSIPYSPYDLDLRARQVSQKLKEAKTNLRSVREADKKLVFLSINPDYLGQIVDRYI